MPASSGGPRLGDVDPGTGRWDDRDAAPDGVRAVAGHRPVGGQGRVEGGQSEGEPGEHQNQAERTEEVRQLTPSNPPHTATLTGPP
ncbi:hypothetical protein GCM10020358_46170 [Amorphoplanes nipponensis]